MTLKDWDDVPYGAADCVRDHTEWNNMIAYIKHAGSCNAGAGHILYNNDASAIEWFKFYENSVDFLGDRAIYVNADETYVGHGAGDAIITGINNTLLGNNAGNTLLSGHDNTMLGMNAGRIGAGINECVFVGTNAGQNAVTSGLTAFGYDALNAACSGINNTAIGHSALLVNTTGYANTAVGKNTLLANIGGYYNTMIGAYSGDIITSGFYNVGVGGGTFRALTTGDNNTAVGTSAGGAAAADTNSCLYLGFNSGFNNAASNRLYINNSNSAFPLIYGEFDNDIVKFGNNTDAWFLQVTKSGDDTTVEGGSVAGDDLIVKCNSAQATPKITLTGGGEILYDSTSAHYIQTATVNYGILGKDAGTNFQIQSAVVNADIILNPNGSGLVRFGTYAAITAEVLTGFLTMKDEGGTSRKVAIIA